MSVAAPEPADGGVYTVDGGRALDALIDAHLAGVRDQLLAALPAAELDVLALGGGYGRGEGGVVAAPDGPRPYNDYDLVLVHRVRDRARLARVLDEVHREQSRRCGVHVDVTPIARARVARLPPALTWYELGAGHRVVWGDGEVLAPLRARRLADVHPTEWGRLLVNRASGLVFARRALAGEPCGPRGDEDLAAFVERQLQKAWLAYGDVRLAAAGRYRPLVRERAQAIEAAFGDMAWTPRWRDAAAFKLRPRTPRAPAALARALAELAPSMADELRARRASPPRPFYGLACTLRCVAPRRWLASPPWRYPRERVRLACAGELVGDLATRDRLCGSAAGFERLWARFG